MKLRLYFPTDNFWYGQGFGRENTAPSLLPLYEKYGLLGHNGLDVFANDGDPIRAAHDGVITYTGEDGASGLLVVIRTNEPFEYEGQEVYFKTLYGHLKKDSIRVRVSQAVRTGDIIALADNTGASTGTHLHWGLKPQKQGEADWQWDNLLQNNGYRGAINPIPYFTGEPAKNMAIRFQLIEALKRLKELYLILLNKRS